MTEEQIKKIVENSLLKADHVFEYPPVCLEIAGQYGNQIFATLGNFSTILAAPKVGKTSATAIIVSALLSERQISNFIPSLPDNKKVVVWADTEQANPECVTTIQLISKQVCGNKKQHPKNLKFSALRKHNSTTRIEAIEYLIKTTQNIGFLVIDGIRDLVKSINDEREATFIADNLLRWSQEYNIHILAILHQNKGDTNGRGHIGSELMNKAETVISLERSDNNGKRTTIIEPKLTRHKEFEAFAFTIDKEDIIESEIKQAYQSKSPKPNELTVQEINSIMKEIFPNGETYSYKPLQNKVKEITSRMFESFGDNKCIELIKKLNHEGYIIQRDGSRNYSFNKYPL